MRANALALVVNPSPILIYGNDAESAAAYLKRSGYGLWNPSGTTKPATFLALNIRSANAQAIVRTAQQCLVKCGALVIEVRHGREWNVIDRIVAECGFRYLMNSERFLYYAKEV